MKRIILIMAILLPTIAAAQDLKPPIRDTENLRLDTHSSKVPHKFWDVANIALHSVSLGSAAFDAYETHRALKIPGTREANPMLRLQSGMIGLKLAAFAYDLSAAAILHAEGHHRGERFIPIINAIPQGLAAWHNSTLRKGSHEIKMGSLIR